MYRKAALAATALGIGSLAAGPALTAHPSQAAKNRIVITAHERQAYKINRYVLFGLRWNRDVYTIRSGGTIVFRNTDPEEPHTLSVLAPKQLPHTTKQINNCGA